jgi:hypothetical protein
MTEVMPGEHKQEAHHSKRHARFATRLNVVLILVLIGTAALFGFLYFRSRAELHQARQASLANTADEARALVKKIGIHIALPSEKPTIATVENTKKLANQVFFKNARNGDKVLMYTQSKKAILYRPSEDKVIEVAYLNIKK